VSSVERSGRRELAEVKLQGISNSFGDAPEIETVNAVLRYGERIVGVCAIGKGPKGYLWSFIVIVSL